MHQLSFTTKYIENYRHKYDLSDDDIAPQTYAMYWCMMATNMNRLFTRQEIHEFLVRLAITLDTLDVVESWFAYDKLVPFKMGETYYALKVEDIYAHMGFEAVDFYTNQLPRDIFLRKIANNIKTAMFVGVLEHNFQVIQPRKEAAGGDTYVIEGEEHSPEITSDLIKKADFFAHDVLKMPPESLFDDIPHARKEKMMELERRKEVVRNLPKFSLQMLSEETIEQCMVLMLGSEIVQELKQEPEDYQEESYRLIHLAWLFANDLVWGDEYDWNYREGVDLDPDDYELEDGGINLYETYEDYNMAECEHLLKGILF